MSLRAFVRIAALALGLTLASPLAWSSAGALPFLAGLSLLALTLGYLALLAGEGDLSRWRLRYRLDGEADQGDLEHLEAVLRFLAEKTGHFVLEASAAGLVLELPAAFDRYVEAHLPQALPELKLSRDQGGERSRTRGASFFCLGPPGSDALRWATEGAGRTVRLHIHPGPHATLLARTDGERPPGRWLRLRLPRRFGQDLPLWDELSSGVRLSSLFPPPGPGSVYSSRSRLLHLVPPDGYEPDELGRPLGLSTAGRRLTLDRALPLFTVGAPPSFLVQQALGDLGAGRTVLVVSPRRRTLERIGQQSGGVPVYWLDPQNSRTSAHLALVSAEEWPTQDMETVIQVGQTFLADASRSSAGSLGLDVALPAVGDFVRRLLRVLAAAARGRGQSLSFADLYAVSQSTQALRVFLLEVQGLVPGVAEELRAQLDDEAGYVQAVTSLSAIHAVLEPLGAGPLRTLCQPPFLNASQALRENSLLLVPMTNADFRQHDRLLSAILDLTLRRLLAAGDDLRLALHLHEPHPYRHDGGQRWIDVARRDPRLSLLLDVREPDTSLQEGGQVVFRCSPALAASLIAAWDLPASAADLGELPGDTAIACLPSMVVTLKVSSQ